MNRKGIKTTIVAVLVGLLGIATFIMWFIGKVDNAGLAIGLSGIATFGTTIGLWLAKDADKSHTQNEPSNKKQDHIGPRPPKR